jgi:hypothetical protein
VRERWFGATGRRVPELALAGQLELDDETGWLAAVRAVRRGARVERVRQCEFHAVDVDRAALVEADGLAVGHALLPEPADELDHRDDRRAVLLRDRHRVADVVAVPVRDRDDVRALGLLLVRWTLGVPLEDRVDVDAFAGRRVEPERGVAEPRERRVRHRSAFVVVQRA